MRQLALVKSRDVNLSISCRMASAATLPCLDHRPKDTEKVATRPTRDRQHTSPRADKPMGNMPAAATARKASPKLMYTAKASISLAPQRNYHTERTNPRSPNTITALHSPRRYTCALVTTGDQHVDNGTIVC